MRVAGFPESPDEEGTESKKMKGAFPKVLAAVRTALEKKPAPVHRSSASPNLPATSAARCVGMVSQFADELERVNGHFMGLMSPGELCEKIVALTHEIRPRSIAVGEAVALDLAPVVQALGRTGIDLIRCGKSNDSERLALREQLARCDLAVVEAHYAIAATGTLVVVATPGRPGSLTLLPPANVILVDAARVLPDMAAVVSALGPGVVTEHRVAFITGPSRTADIEKMIVLGVHGPKDLYAAAVWPGEGKMPSRQPQ
jgi:L-lactate utilization protein LutC